MLSPWRLRLLAQLESLGTIRAVAAALHRPIAALALTVALLVGVVQAYGTFGRGVEFFPEHSDRPFYGSSTQTLKNQLIMSMPLEIAERVRVVWRASNKQPVEKRYGTSYLERLAK